MNILDIILAGFQKFQKCPHPVDSWERHDLYWMNYLTSQQLAANLIVLLDRDTDVGSQEQEGDALVCFPSEEEIMDALQQTQTSEKPIERQYHTQQTNKWLPWSGMAMAMKDTGP